MKKYSSIIIVGIMFMSVFGLFASSAPVQEPEPELPVFIDAYITPENPIGHDWTTLLGGDTITVYAETDGSAAQLWLESWYCERSSLCYPPAYTPLNDLGGGMYSCDFPGDPALGTASYDASSSTATHVYYKIYANDGTNATVEEYPSGGGYIYFYPAWPPSQINASAAASKTVLFPDETFWVNGTSNFWNSTSFPNNYTELLPVADSDVTVSINPDYFGVTDADGDFSVQAIAPTVPGIYTVNTTVSNSTPNRNVVCVCTEFQIEVLGINATIDVSPSTTTPNATIDVTGQSFFSDGTIPEGADVNVTIIETGDFNVTTVDVTGDYSVQMVAPNATGNYHVNVTVHNVTHNMTAWNETLLRVDPTPLADLAVETGDIVVIGPRVEGQNHTINVTVENKGSAAALNAQIRTQVNGTSLNSTRMDLPVGGSVTLSILWRPEAGEMNISVAADPLDEITESSETNNTAWRIVQISSDSDGDGIPDAIDDDDDNDGYLDVWEIFLGTDPFDDLDTPLDTDDDGEPDGNATNSETWMDTDDDDDGTPDDQDAFPTDPDEDSDYDGDGIGDNADPDDDNDGYTDATDDPFPNDTDNDGLTNDVDLDDDGDGIPDTEDTYPLDTDNDGQNNAADSDDDGDGVPDVEEDLNWNGIVDSGEVDWLNSDTDGDGVDDDDDYDPLDSGVTGPPPSKGMGILLPVVIVVIVIVVVFALAYVFVIKKD